VPGDKSLKRLTPSTHLPPSADSLGGAGCHYPDFQNFKMPTRPAGILTDGLVNLMPLQKPTGSNEADWREARMWLREMAGMGLHRIQSIMDGMNLLPTKLKSKTSAQAKSLIETVACSHSKIQDVS